MNRSILWTKHRFCPKATKYTDSRQLEYDLKNPDGNSFIYADRNQLIETIDVKISNQGKEVEGLKDDKHRTAEEFVRYVKSIYEQKLSRFRDEMTILGNDRRKLKATLKSFECSIRLAESNLTTAKQELEYLNCEVW